MQMKRILGSRQWGGKAALLAIVLASLWCDASARAAEKVALGSSIRIDFTIDGKAVPAEISYEGPKEYENSKTSTEIKLQRGDDYRFRIEYRQDGERYCHLVSGTVDWAGIRRVPIAFSKIKAQGPLKYATVNGQMTIVGCDTSVKWVAIPEKIEGRRVTSIGDSSFFECSGLKSVTIPQRGEDWKVCIRVLPLATAIKVMGVEAGDCLLNHLVDGSVAFGLAGYLNGLLLGNDGAGNTLFRDFG